MGIAKVSWKSEPCFMHAYCYKWDTLTEEIMGVLSLKVNHSNS